MKFTKQVDYGPEYDFWHETYTFAFATGLSIEHVLEMTELQIHAATDAFNALQKGAQA